MKNSPGGMGEGTSARRRTCQQKAREVLFYKSNWVSLLLIEGGILLYLASARFFVGSFGYAVILSGLLGTDKTQLYPFLVPAALLFLFLLSSPIFAGLVSYSYDMVRIHEEEHGTLSPSVLFAPYASLESVTRSWVLIFIRTVTYALIFASVFLIGAMQNSLHLLSAGIESAALRILSEVLLYSGGLLLVLGTTCLYLLTTPVLFLSITRPELSVSDCLVQSIRIMRRNLLKAALLWLSFLPLLILSVLTGGILLFLYVLPYYLLTYISFCASVTTQAG